MTDKSQSNTLIRTRPAQQKVAELRKRPLGELRCPQCSRMLLRTNNGEAVYLARVTLFRGGKAAATCPTCKTRVNVPLRLVR